MCMYLLDNTGTILNRESMAPALLAFVIQQGRYSFKQVYRKYETESLILPRPRSHVRELIYVAKNEGFSVSSCRIEVDLL